MVIVCCDATVGSFSNQQTSSNSILWSLKYFWWGCFAPVVCCARPGSNSPLCPLSYATVQTRGPQRSPICGVSLYLCLHPLTQNDQINVVTRTRRGLFLGILPPPSEGGGAQRSPNFCVPLYLYLQHLTTKNDQGDTFGGGMLLGVSHATSPSVIILLLKKITILFIIQLWHDNFNFSLFSVFEILIILILVSFPFSDHLIILISVYFQFTQF